MKLLSRALAPLALALSLVAPAVAQEYVKTKDGTLIKGDATAYDEATETLTFRMQDGRVRGFKLSELDLRSVYLVNRSRVPKDDFDKQLRIGELATEVGLYAHAMRHFDQARKADPSRGAEADAAVAELERKAASFAMQKAKDAVSKGNLREAEKWLVKLTEKLPDEPEGAQAQQMLDQYYARNRREREAEVLARATAAQQQSLELAKGHYDAMVEKTRKGLTGKSSGNASVASWQSALKDGGRALKALAAIDPGGGGALSSDQLDGYRRMVIDQMVEIHLHLASLWTVRSSFNQALTETNQALALDPRSEQALAARARIERAASERRWIW